MEAKKYVLTLTKDYVDGFVMGVVTVVAIGFYKKYINKTKKGEA